MEKLIYAKWASPAEMGIFFDSINKKRKRDYLKSLAYLEHHKEEIINQYHLLDKQYERLNEKEALLMFSSYNAWKNNTCICGGELELVDKPPHFFIGCKDFKKDTFHINFALCEDYDDYYSRMYEHAQFRTDNWVLMLKHKTNLPKSVSLHSIYKFIINNGYDCLNQKYKTEDIEDKLNNFRDAKKRGVHFEKEVKEILQKKHQKIAAQQAIKYQYNERNQLYAILDFLAIDEDCITIYECKLNEDLIDDKQRFKYMELVSYIMLEKSINKRLEFFYVYKNSEGEIVFEKYNKEDSL